MNHQPWRWVAVAILALIGCTSQIPPGESYNICQCRSDEICVKERCVPLGSAELLEFPGAGGEIVDRAGCDVAQVRIEEIRYAADDVVDFIELSGPPGTDLLYYRLLAVDLFGKRVVDARLNGTLNPDGLWLGTFGEGLQGDELAQSALTGQIPLGATGFAAPMGSVVLFDCEDNALDALSYGDIPADAVQRGEGDNARAVSSGHSLSRCPGGADTGDNFSDFQPTANPSPGMINNSVAESPGCVGCDTSGLNGKLWISEFLYDPAGADEEKAAFLELRSSESIELEGVSVEIWVERGEVWQTLGFLTGNTGEDGRFLIAEDDSLDGADAILDGIDLDNDAGSIRIVGCEREVLDVVSYGVLSESVGAAASSPEAQAPDIQAGRSAARCPDDERSGAWQEDPPSPGNPNCAAL